MWSDSTCSGKGQGLEMCNRNSLPPRRGDRRRKETSSTAEYFTGSGSSPGVSGQAVPSESSTVFPQYSRVLRYGRHEGSTTRGNTLDSRQHHRRRRSRGARGQQQRIIENKEGHPPRRREGKTPEERPKIPLAAFVSRACARRRGRHTFQRRAWHMSTQPPTTHNAYPDLGSTGSRAGGNQRAARSQAGEAGYVEKKHCRLRSTAQLEVVSGRGQSGRPWSAPQPAQHHSPISAASHLGCRQREGAAHLPRSHSLRAPATPALLACAPGDVWIMDMASSLRI